jgi:riboflavin transporter FmnP
MPRTPRPHWSSPYWAGVRDAAADCAVLAVACLLTYLLTTRLLSGVYIVSKNDDLLGGMWAVIATIFVNRDSYRQSLTAAASRMAATSVSFVICLVYLLFLPFHTWALPVLIGASALAVTLIGRPDDAITAAITTTVVMIVAAVSPQHAWQQPILRFADTVIGAAVGIAAAWADQRVIRPRITRKPRVAGS